MRAAPRTAEPPVALEPRKAGQLRPMLATIVEEPFDSPDHIFEVQWGGVRVIAEVDNGQLRLQGRNLRDLTPLYPELSVLPKCLRARSAVVDGEIIAWDVDTIPSSELLRPRLLQPDETVSRRRRSPLMYQVFDILELDGISLTSRPLFERRNLLHEHLATHRVIQIADFIESDGIAFFDAVVSHHLEGVIAKDRWSPYLPGERSGAWQEIRASQADNFVVGGYSFGGGQAKEPIASLLLGTYKRGELVFVSEVSIGCSHREAQLLIDLLTPLHTEVCPFPVTPIVPKLIHWCQPELACHVRYAQWHGGRLRFPLFVAPRPDVPASECVQL